MKIAWISAAFLAFVCFFQNGDAAVSAWTVPDIPGSADGAGTLTIQENQATSETITTFAATGATSYSLVTAVSPFGLGTDGALTITAALDYATASSYTLLIKAEDSADPPTSGTATITVTVNTAPSFATSYSPCILDASVADTTLVTVSATDANGDTPNYALTGSGFKIDSSTGLIQVDGVTLDKATTPSYALVVTADDGTLTSTTTVSVTVADVCSSAVGVAASLMALLAALLVNIF
ncbi:protocadherin-16-like [Mercenaria mercenaria]|uniref:protocadherin-16-like n=1 Tax=Mercenaria mercenaria TaxID=6596 RepID=UPI00234E38BA|nr:protocadherin-16-like [Mercenaria mercenaria]